MTLTAGYFTTGPALTAHVEDGHWWATCPGCPGWSAAADSWTDLFALVSEWHASAEAPHHAWTMIAPVVVTERDDA